MPAQQNHYITTAYLAEGADDIAIGDAVVLNAAGTGWVKATTANVTAASRDAGGIALSAADDDNRAFELQSVGVVAASVTNLGAGTASAINVSSAGILQRCATSASDIVGKCDTDGVAYVGFHMPWDAISVLSGGGTPTGTGFPHITSGTQDAAAKLVENADVHASAAIAPTKLALSANLSTWFTTASSANLRAAVTDETGTGALFFAGGDFGAATGTSAALTTFWSTGGTPATTGAGRMANDTYIYIKDSGGADRRLLGSTSTGVHVVGNSDWPLNVVASTALGLWGDAITCRTSAGTILSILDTTALKLEGQLWVNDGGGQYYKFAFGNIAADRTITWPVLTGNDVPVLEAHTQTLTNKTLTSPTIGGTPVISATSTEATGNARAKVYSDIANVQTTDATVTTLFSFTPTDEAVTMFTAEVLAVLSTGAETNAYVRRVRIKRDGGTVTVGTVEETYTSEETAAWDCTVDSSGTTVRVRITGEAAHTIDWGGVFTRLEVTHA